MLDSIQPKKPLPNRLVRKRPRINKIRNKRLFNGYKLKLAIVLIILLVGGVFVGNKIITFANKVVDNNDGGFFGQLFLANNQQLQGEESGEVKILLLGIGGEGHDGGTLTDTIILATIKVPENGKGEYKASLVSIPRDLTVFIPGYDYRKINAAYAFGEINNQKNGPQMSIQAVERIIGEEIPYYAVIDFKGFETVVDELGGVEIDVPVTFTDSRFPNENEGYLDPITFEQGKQKMDGTEALQYVRSRHGNNGQGSDFARSQRQRQLIAAIKEEVTNVRVLTNFNLISRLLDAVSDNFRTNIELHEMKRLYDIGKNIKQQNIFSLSLNVESGLLCNDIVEETGAYILTPCLGLTDYSQIRNLINTQFTTGIISTENPTIEIQNSTSISGLSQNVQTYLNLPSQNVSLGNYRGNAQYLETVIYDNSGDKPGTKEFLQTQLKATVAGSAFPFPTVGENPDFVIVITEDIQNLIEN